MKSRLGIGMGVLGGAAVTYVVLNAGLTGLEPSRTFESEFSLDSADDREPLAATSSAARGVPVAAQAAPTSAAPNAARGRQGRAGGPPGPAAELRRLMQSDPKAAFAEALRIADAEQRPGPLLGVLAGWGEIDRAAALAAALELAAARGGERVLALIQSALRTADVAEAQSLFHDAERSFPPEQAAQVRHVTLRMISAQNPDLAAREFAQMRDQEGRAQLGRAIAEDFAARDPYAALEWARGLVPPTAGVEATVIGEIARSDPYAAVDLAAKIRLPNGIPRLTQHIVDVALQDGGVSIARLAEAALRTAGAANGDRVVQGVMTGWAEREPRATLDWLVAQAGGVPNDLFALTAAAIGQRNADLGVTYASRVPPELRNDWVASIAQGYARADPQAAAGWVGSLRGDPAYSHAVSPVASSLAAVDGPAAARLLATTGLEDDRVRGVVAAVAREWARKDAAAAANWSASLPEAVRDGALAGVMNRWLQDDFANARGWVTSYPRGDGRDRLLALTINFAAAQGRFEGVLLADFESEAARSIALRTGIAVVAQRDEWAARDALNRYVSDTALRAELERLLDSRRVNGPR